MVIIISRQVEEDSVDLCFKPSDLIEMMVMKNISKKL